MYLVPPRPIASFVYRCDSVFHCEALFALYDEAEPAYGLACVAGDEARMYVAQGTRVALKQRVRVDRMKQHKCGGQSSARFGRIREAQIDDYVKRVAQALGAAFLDAAGGVPLVRGVVLAGCGPVKDQVAASGWLSERLRSLLLGALSVDAAALASAEAVLALPEARALLQDSGSRELRAQERVWQQRLDTELARIVYGREEVLRALEQGELQELLATRAAAEEWALAARELNGCALQTLAAGQHSSLLEQYGGALALRWYAREEEM